MLRFCQFISENVEPGELVLGLSDVRGGLKLDVGDPVKQVFKRLKSGRLSGSRIRYVKRDFKLTGGVVSKDIDGYFNFLRASGQIVRFVVFYVRGELYKFGVTMADAERTEFDVDVRVTKYSSSRNFISEGRAINLEMSEI